MFVPIFFEKLLKKIKSRQKMIFLVKNHKTNLVMN